MSPTVAEGYDAVRNRIESACRRAGRDLDSVRLVAISKAFQPDRVRKLLECGHTLLGENRVQEALPKMDELGPVATWHFVGHLQSNKVRQVVGRFELIHSLDGESLAREIDRRCDQHDLRQPVLIQVHLGGEASKFGVAEGDLAPLIDSIVSMSHLDLRGLMAVPPPATGPDGNRKWFARLRELRDECRTRSGLDLPELSMGMTDDFEVAIEEGATLVRIGRAIFGERSSSR
jgi:pyridoxal phosphate enzyme (YggS family)